MKKNLFIAIFIIIWSGCIIFATAGEISSLQSIEKQEIKTELIVETETSPTVAIPVTETMSGEEVNWSVVSAGGAMQTSSVNYSVSGTIGQNIVGASSSANYATSHGFWQVFSGPNCCVTPGDANHDTHTNIADASYIINKVFFSGPDYPCEQEADATGDGKENIADASYLINYIFFGGPDPVCGPA